MGAENEVVLCHAHKHGGAPCDRPVAPGKRVCTWHGGAPGVGRPRVARQPRKHKPPIVSHPVNGLEYEIAYMRVVVRQAIEDGADIDTIGKGMILLDRLTRVDVRLHRRSERHRPAIVADVIQRLGGQMGLWELLS